jgi:hypothetical protein
MKRRNENTMTTTIPASKIRLGRWARISYALIVCASLCACGPVSRWQTMRTLTAELEGEPHECLPLGWAPLPTGHGDYVIRASVERDQFRKGAWLPAAWVGRIQNGQLTSSTIRAIASVLTRLQDKGLVIRSNSSDGASYYLSARGLQYYYDRDAYGNNPLHLPFLCYSALVPQRIVAIRSGYERQVAFTWRSSTAEWGNDRSIESHSVFFQPVQSPAIAKLVRRNGDWVIVSLSAATSGYPQLVDADAWMTR